MSKPLKDIIIYHANCMDGFTAAWIVNNALNDEESIFAYKGFYQRGPMPNLITKNTNVIIVDFSYKRKQMEEIYEAAKSLTWIDHHKNALDDMYGFAADKDPARYFEKTSLDACGAMLTWQHFFPDREPPQLLKHIDDRDRWVFDLPGTREINAAMFSYPYNFEYWDKLFDDAMIPTLLADGVAIDRKHMKDVKELLEMTQTYRNIFGHKNIPIANMPHTLVSDAANIMAKESGADFAVGYYIDAEGKAIVSLRSIPGGADVSEIAKKYGGGGHARAAGCRVNLSELL